MAETNSGWNYNDAERSNRIHASVFVSEPRSIKHAESFARTLVPEGWEFGGVTKAVSSGWYRAWAWRKPPAHN